MDKQLARAWWGQKKG